MFHTFNRRSKVKMRLLITDSEYNLQRYSSVVSGNSTVNVDP
jgi:hypothetical protein